MNVAGKRIAILGGTRITCEIVKAAKALGLHTTVIDYNPPELSPAKLIADEHALISVADTDEVAAYLVANGIDGVTVGYTDSILGFFADICEKAQLPCYGTRDQFELFTNKHLWKEACRKHGVPTALEYDVSILNLAAEEIDFPLFVKPSDGSGARGTSIARDYDELVRSVSFAQSFAKNGDVLIEKYLAGREVTVFWLFIDGEYRVFLLGNRHVKNNQEGVIPLPAGYSFPASVLPRYLDEIAPKVRSMLREAGVKNGMMFMQCIVQDGLPHVYDIGFRLTGSLEHYIVAQTAGYSPMDMMLRHAVTGCMTDDPDVFTKIDKGLYEPCFNVSYLMKPGMIDHFEGYEEVLAFPEVIEAVKAHVEGETLPPEALGELRQIALRVLGKVADAADLVEAMLRAQDRVRIVDPAGENLVLPGMDSSDIVGTVLPGRDR